jgi:hypothetical protein
MANMQQWEASRLRAQDAWERIQQRYRQAHTDASEGRLDREGYEVAKQEYVEAQARYEQFMRSYEEAVPPEHMPAPAPVQAPVEAAFDPLAAYVPGADDDDDYRDDPVSDLEGVTLARPEQDGLYSAGDDTDDGFDYDASLQAGGSRSRMSTLVLVGAGLIALIVLVMIGRSAFGGGSGKDAPSKSSKAAHTTPHKGQSAPHKDQPSMHLNAALVTSLARQSQLREQASADARSAAGYVFSISDDQLAAVKSPLFVNLLSARARTEVVLATLPNAAAAQAAVSELRKRSKAPSAKLSGADEAVDYRNGACPTTLIRSGATLAQLTTRPVTGACTKVVPGQLAQHEAVRSNLAALLG